MKIFVDYLGHLDLDYSMHALFEKRLGATIYRPTMDCWNHILNGSKNDPIHKKTAIENKSKRIDHYLPMLAIPFGVPKSHYTADNILHSYVPSHNYTQRFIGFKDLIKTDFDFMVTTCWGNESTFLWIQKNLLQNAQVIRQIANIHEHPQLIPNVLKATLEPMEKWVNSIICHPEHPPHYQPQDNSSRLAIKSFFNDMPLYSEVTNSWEKLKNLLPDYRFAQHGRAGTESSVPQADLYKAMQDSTFVFHSKPTGSCGYVAREALFCGKPIIANKSYAKIHNTLARSYLKDCVNLIDIDPKVRSLEDAAKIIKEWSKPDIYSKKCKQALEFTHQQINFEAEANSVSSWLDRLEK